VDAEDGKSRVNHSDAESEEEGEIPLVTSESTEEKTVSPRVHTR
jgi:hypothetical protein